MTALYEMVIRNMVITRESLKFKGYTDEEINYLLQTQKLIAVNNQYQFNDVEGLYKYGESFIIHFNSLKAKACFKKCRQLNPTHRSALLQRFFQLFSANQIQEALSCFDIILTIEPEKYYEENNLYTYLISLLEDVPEKYIAMVNVTELSQIKGTSSEEKNLENEIKRTISENKLTFAMSLLNDLLAKYPTYTISRGVLKLLLSKAIDNDELIKATIFKMINKECYYELIQYLENIKKRRKLDTQEYYIFYLSKVLIDLINSKVIPTITAFHPRNISEALRGNNFEEAIIQNKLFLRKNNRDKKEDPIMILLKRICKMINQLKLEESALEVDKEELNADEPMDLLDNSSDVGEITEIPSNDSRDLNDILFFMKERNLSLEDLIINYNLNFEEIQILKLLMAKDCYSLGFEALGDKYLKEVSEQPGITERVSALLVEIQKNKKTIIYGISRKRKTEQ